MVQKSGIQCYNCKEYRHVARESDWKDDTDDESDDQELEAQYMYMAKLQQVSPDAVDSGPIFDTEPEQKVQNDDHYDVFAIKYQHIEQSESAHNTYLLEQDAQNVSIESVDMNYDSEQIDQNDEDVDLAKERELLASLIAKLKCDIDDSKNRNKFLETSNKVLVEKLKGEIEGFKNKNKSLESSNNRFKEANNKLPETNKLMYTDLKKFQAELDRRNDVEYASKELCAHQETISILSQAKEAQIKLYKTREDKELDKVIALENKVKVLNNIVYKTGQSVQTINILNSKCKMSFAKPEFLKKAQRADPRLYDIGCYNDNLALMLAPESDKVIRLEKESRSKLSDLIRPFDYDKLNNLYDLFVPQREKSSKQRYFSERSSKRHTPLNNGNSKESFNKQTTLLEKQMDESILWDQKCKSSKELFKIKRSVGTIFDGEERCKETIAKRTYFGHVDPFIQNTIEANFCPEIRRLNADLEKFHVCLKEEMVADLRYFNSLELEVVSLKSQLETQKTQFLNEIDRLSKEYYYADHMNAIVGVYTELDEVTTLQYDYLELFEKCECLENELSKSKMILNAKTSNVNFICATCGKCMLNEKHDMCVLKSLKGVNSRTKFPIAVPVAKPLRKTVASESTNQKPRNTFRKLYERVRNASRTANILEPMTSRHSTVSNTPLSSNSFAARRDYPIHRLNHNLFFVGQFCDADLKVAFRKSACYILDLKGNDLLTGSRGTNLYSITLQDTTSPNPICLMANATSSQAWLWHRRLSHLNFDTINLLSKNDIVVGLPK
nr:integrase, catalytic region, zinc finger, CCHC-type, peptidase aspartic, catalytic [Tanacetum cinerariifolium]